MTCDQCQNKMINVGRMTQPGNSGVWADGYLCRTKRCPGYAILSHDGSESRWPAATLDGGVPLHSKIQGAMRFRDAV